MSMIFSALVREVPSEMRSSSSGVAMSRQTAPWLRPSNVTVPIITSTKATVPARTSSFGSPPSGGRTPTTRSRVSNGEIREKRLK